MQHPPGSCSLRAVHQCELPITALRERDPEFAEILRRARAGSATAFDELVKRIREQIRRWARRLTPDTDDAEDVAQLVLLQLHVH
jgi:Sigma-70 region 2